ncbi:hypothetical protein SAMN05192558_107173 [Actinokineospora alba]|uniref:Uncharacterized protein n=1 Tax=Actinokineospora alba TaxID=504798 RepID=A0A1H0QXJ9_9PSEU|nr:hypothetical protein [Actinokineospora alba]TDP70368.1 hypothetical protein C8E96_5978 [Actinokineospora alba]SDI33172.1 hypothetical protein SAMN05421871_104172 [Actinokineospora alba]SDP21478.1 hypothetical protein SAMN05192558_107173 [Actinokineospora alba]
MPSRSRKPRKERRVEVDPLRFVDGWGSVVGPPAEAEAEGIRVDLVRPSDLVALSVTASGCELITGGGAPARLRSTGDEARLTVRFAFQHLGEQAIYEGFVPGKPMLQPDDQGKPVAAPAHQPPDEGPGVVTQPPVGVVPARSSRLVFKVPAGETIEFSTAGILAAMSRLQLAVHPLALPGDAPAKGGVDGLSSPTIALPGGLIAELTANGAVISKAKRAQTVADVAFEARELRRARTELQARTPTTRARTTLPDEREQPSVTIGETTIPVSSLFGPGGLIRDPIRARRARRTLSRPAAADETAIEAPYRLVISPSDEARWAHATEPVVADDAAQHIELWHSRLAIAAERPDGSIVPDEHNTKRRVIRAVWARDRDTVGEDWKDSANNLGHSTTDPFRMSLDRADRHMLVRQTAETWPGRPTEIEPVPVGAEALWLSSLGAWLDLHGAWTTKPYSRMRMSSLLSWDHVAPMGRDQYVRVVYPGYLYPFGHQAALVKLTERKMKKSAPSVAGLYQRKFLVLGERARTYADNHDFPFLRVEIRPLVTPTLDDPTEQFGDSQDNFFWPKVGFQRFSFVIDALDHELKPVRLRAPLMWVAEHYQDFAKTDKAYDEDPARKVPALGQKIAFGPVRAGGDTVAETDSILLRGKARLGDSTPRMSAAHVSVPAVQALSGTGPVPIAYHDEYRKVGFSGPTNTGELWAKVLVDPAQREHPTDPTTTLPQLKFGAGAPSGSDKAGGFLSPDLPIRGLSRTSGAVGDIVGMQTKQFNPTEFLKSASPKLLGLVSLVDLVNAVTGDALKIPALVSEALDRVEALVADLRRVKAAAEQAVDEANKMIARAGGKTAELQAQAQQALTKTTSSRDKIVALVDQIPALLASLKNKSPAEVAAAMANPLQKLRDEVAELRAIGPTLPPFMRNLIASITEVLADVLAMADLIEDIYRFVNGFDPTSVQARFRFEWAPKVSSWPPGAAPILQVQPDSLLLAVEGRASGKGKMGVQALAELRDFTLHLLPGAPLVRVPFEHLSFKSGTAGKPEVDVVLGEIEFLGILGFVEVIKDLIPFDGFSDPPFMEVTPAGMTAGFTLTLPNLAIGVFTLSNLSLDADVQVPFLGKAVTFGFNFCTRERPFTLAVLFLGGGGWFGIRVSPDGLDVLELGLEAGAVLSVDLGVASGSISAMVGVYMRLEGEKGSLTGYFRLRGEVDVLGLISASIELYMELKYEFDTGKMIGRATITVEVDVLVFSGSVKISAERKFAGSNGDPTFKQIMGVAGDGSSPAWSAYCLAFAEE